MILGTLYNNGYLCPFAHRVLIASRELNVSIDSVYCADIPAAVRAVVPDGGWPVFVPSDGGEMLMDSSDVVDHLIVNSGDSGRTFRSEPEVLAAVETLVDCIRKVALAPKPTIQRDYRQKLDLAFAKVDKIRQRADGPFLGGEHFSQADCYVTPFLHRLPFLVEIRDHVPEIFLHEDGLKAWVDRVVNRPSFQEIAPKRHVLRQFYAEKAKYGKPMKVGRLHHSGFRGMWADLAARTSSPDLSEDRDNQFLQEARHLCYLLFRTVALHAKFENLVLFPALDAATGDSVFTAEGITQHEHEVGEMNNLLELFDRALGQEPGSRADTLLVLATEVERIKEGQLAHLDYEEATFMPVLAELDSEQHLDMLRGAYEMCILERPHVIGVLASYMPIENILSLLDSLLQAVEPASEQWRQLLTEMHAYLTPEKWLKVVRRFEEAIPTSLMVVPAGRCHGSFATAARALEAAVPVERIEIPKAALHTKTGAFPPKD